MGDLNSLLPPESPVNAPEIPPAQKPSTLRMIFLGAGGIRAGWRFAMYLVMVILIGAAGGWVLNGWHTEGAARLWAQMLGECILVVASAVPAFIMARIEKRTFSDYGLPKQNAFGKMFWVGAAWGIVAITLLLGALRGLHGFYFGHLALHGVRIVKFALFWGVFFVFVGLFEEFMLRGYTQFTLTAGIGFWPSAVVLSSIFGAIHLTNPGEAWAGALAAGLIGLFFCLTLRRTGDLWFAVGLHFSFDWGETFLYSVPNSGTTSPGHLLSSSFHGPRWLTGGSVGPEGSVFVFALIGLMWVVFDRVYPEVKYKML
jgi:hypothetical protein